MQIGRRTIMVAGTFFLAAATGHMMQSGLLAGSRLVSGGQDGVVGELTQASLTSADGSGDVKLASTNLYLGGDARMVSAILG